MATSYWCFTIVISLIPLLTKQGVLGAEYKHLGCYVDSSSARDLNSLELTIADVSVDSCCSECRDRGYAYAGLQSGTLCFCGSRYGTLGASSACNFTCTNGGKCGGVTSNNVYYTIDNAISSQRTYILHESALTFTAARETCVAANGDLATIETDAELNDVIETAGGVNQTKFSSFWFGLRRRLSAGQYEWTNENLVSYGSHSSDFNNYWKLGETLQESCVSALVKTKKWETAACSTTKPFVCLQVAPDDEGGGKDTKVILYIVLPLFLFCYGGSCILYCAHKIYRNCRRNKQDSMAVSKVNTLSDIDGDRRPLYNDNNPYQKKRPLSASKRATVYPAVQPMPPPMGQAPPRQNVPPQGNRINVVPAAPPPTDVVTPRQITASSVDIGMSGSAAPENKPPEPKTPEIRKSAEEEKRSRLLVNALREARERRSAGSDRPNPTDPKPPPPENRPMSGASSSSNKSTTNLLPNDQDESQNMAGMSINEILRKKMANKADKKPKKIVAA